MTSLPRETLLCSYRYDPLNRSMDWAPGQHASIQRFYCKSRLTTELQGAAKYSLLQHDDQVLAQQRQMGDKVDTTLLATDLQRSVLNALNATPPQPFAYTPYGHRPLGNGLLSLLGFNGERPDPVTGHYHLGNGYRQFNPVLMRFNSPDSWSPFGEGGLNAYAYCGGDPRNREDQNGHKFSIFRHFKKPGFIKSSKKTKLTETLNNKETPFKINTTTFKKNNANILISEEKHITVLAQEASMNGRKINLNRDIHDGPFILQTKERIYLHRGKNSYSHGERHPTHVSLDNANTSNHSLKKEIEELNYAINELTPKAINRKLKDIRNKINLDDISRQTRQRSQPYSLPDWGSGDKGPRY